MIKKDTGEKIKTAFWPVFMRIFESALIFIATPACVYFYALDKVATSKGRYDPT